MSESFALKSEIENLPEETFRVWFWISRTPGGKYSLRFARSEKDFLAFDSGCIPQILELTPSALDKMKKRFKGIFCDSEKKSKEIFLEVLNECL